MTLTPIQSTADRMLTDIENAVAALCKNSRLRAHQRVVVVMNKVMQVYLKHFKVGPHPDTLYEMKQAQEALGKAIVRASMRKPAGMDTSDKIALLYALKEYRVLLQNTTDVDLHFALSVVEHGAVLPYDSERSMNVRTGTY